MLEIVWRNPNRLARTRVIVDRTLRHNPETGEAEIIYRTRAATEDADVEYEFVVNWSQPGHAA